MSEGEAKPLLGAVGDKPSEGGQASVTSSVINLSNTIVGAGVLAIPYALRLSGTVPGIAFIFFVFALSSISFIVLGMIAETTQTWEYKKMALNTWGKPVALVGEASILAYTACNMVARPIIIADYVTNVLSQWTHPHSIWVQPWFIVVLCTLAMFPLCALRNIDGLRFTSFASLICVMFCVVAVVIRFVTMVHEQPLPPRSVATFDISMAMAFGLLIVSFTAHYNLGFFYKELSHRSVAKLSKVVWMSTSACLVVYLIIGITGYMSFGNHTKGDILDNYNDSDVLILISRLALALALTFSTPLVCYACRNSILTLFFAKHQPASWLLWIIVTTAILVVAAAVAIVYPHIQVVFAFSGAVFGVTFVYVLPGMFLMRLHTVVPMRRSHMAINREPDDVNLVEVEAEAKPMHRVVAWLLVISGVFMGIVGTTGSVVQTIRSSHDGSSSGSGGNGTLHGINMWIQVEHAMRLLLGS